MTHKNARPPEKVNRPFASHSSPSQKHLSAAEKRRLDAQRDAEDNQALIDAQRQMRADAYRRLFNTSPPGDAA